jgi:hypothetical protein
MILFKHQIVEVSTTTRTGPAIFLGYEPNRMIFALYKTGGKEFEVDWFSQHGATVSYYRQKTVTETPSKKKIFFGDLVEKGEPTIYKKEDYSAEDIAGFQAYIDAFNVKLNAALEAEKTV